MREMRNARACSKYQDEKIRHVRSRRVQCDEIWSFIGSKERNTSEDKKVQGWGDCWTWTALDADTKLMISFRLGDRTLGTAYDFMHDLAERLTNRIQLTTDGHRFYLEAVDSAFNVDIDGAMLAKIYVASSGPETRYSPAVCIGCETKIISATPDPKHVSTSYAERQNLTMRMSMRRFTRLTNAFSKKLENHAAMVSLYFMYYNFGRVHQTLRVTPAMKLASRITSGRLTKSSDCSRTEMTATAARLLIISFGLAIAASLFSVRDVTKPRAITGTVRDWQPGQSISVLRGPDDPDGITFSLRNATYDDDPRAIRPGSRVTVWYKMVGERRLLASRVKLSN